MSRNQFYLFLSVACLIGYGWIGLLTGVDPAELGKSYDVCLIHHLSGFPCPACGSSRSVLSFFRGDFIGGLYWNPLGLVGFLFLLAAPVWIAFDLVQHKQSFYQFYQRAESWLKKKYVAIPLIVLVLINWIWNIWKDV